jgi:hypothetical protein
LTQDLERLIEAGEERGFEIEEDVDYGAGPIDLVWNIDLHPALPPLKCGFVRLEAREAGTADSDSEDNQMSLRKIEEAAIRGIRSGLDKIYLVAENEQMAKSVSGKIEWLASHGSLLRLDAISLGLAPDQIDPAVIRPSQKRVPKRREKITKSIMRDRIAKIEKDSRPRGERMKEKRPKGRSSKSPRMR